MILFGSAFTADTFALAAFDAGSSHADSYAIGYGTGSAASGAAGPVTVSA